jgi:hypothetical protein
MFVGGLVTWYVIILVAKVIVVAHEGNQMLQPIKWFP